MARGRRHRAVRRGMKNQLWTVSIVDEFELTTGLSTAIFSPVVDEDWQRASVSAEKCTVLRVRGWVSVVQELTAGVGGDGTVFAGMVLHDEEATTPNMSLVTSYGEEDLLWIGGHLFGPVERVITVEGGTTSLANQWHFDVDIKAMRKMRTGQAMDMVFTNLLPSSVEISGVLRALVRIGG